MYLDYKAKEITKQGKDNLVDVISNAHGIKKEIVVRYIKIYHEYPYVTFNNYDSRNIKITRKRLKNITRSIKIKKIKLKI